MNIIEFTDAPLVTENPVYGFASNTVTMSGSVISDSSSPNDGVLMANAAEPTSAIVANFGAPVRSASMLIDTGPQGTIAVGYDALGRIIFAEQFDPTDGQAALSYASRSVGLSRVELYSDAASMVEEVDGSNLLSGAVDYLDGLLSGSDDGLLDGLIGNLLGGLFGGGGEASDPFVEADLSLMLDIASVDAQVTVGSTEKMASAVPAFDRIEFDDSFDNAVIGALVNDPASVTSGDNFVVGSDADDTVDALGGDDVIDGQGGDDILAGNAGDDILMGGEGNDTLLGGAGADTLDGGAGNDTASYDDAESAVRADLRDAEQAAGSAAAGDVYHSIENLVGSDFNDLLIGDDGINRLVGQAGNDLLSGMGGDDRLLGGDGNDALLGGLGADYFDGGAGNDRVSYADATDSVRVDLAGSARNVGAYAEGDAYVNIENLVGSTFNDDLRGDEERNVIYGGEGRDVLTGRGGADNLNGGAGDDILTGGADADRIDGGDGRDIARYVESATGVKADLQVSAFNNWGASGDTFHDVEDLNGSHFDDDLRGDAGDNMLLGNDGDDFLTGRDGNDELRGGAGDDFLSGGAGNDILGGSLGADRFHFNRMGEADADVVIDFQVGIDTLRLDNAMFTALDAGQLDAGMFHVGAVALDANDHLIYDGQTLSYDADGNGALDSVVIASFSNGADLAADDFLIV